MESFGNKTFIIRSGRTSPAQKRALEELYPLYGLAYAPDRKFNFKEIFAGSGSSGGAPIVEIGFGAGVTLLSCARENPDKNYLGIEVFRAGIGRVLMELRAEGLRNVRVMEHDAVEVLGHMTEDASIAAFHIFFPDPWPKKRHHKRRLLSRPLTNMLCQKLVPGGYLYAVTDWEDYAQWAMAELSATEGLVNKYGEGVFAPHQAWRPLTRFEDKGLKKEHVIKELFFVKN
jgi:tRNA (guanine-N7-)-methyltransferase